MKKLFEFLQPKKHSNSKLIEKESTYDTLSPTILEVEEIQTYISAINEAVGDSRNKNIAITGAYGSGKSSILQTYQSIKPLEKFLNISLANFKVDKLDPEDPNQEDYYLKV